MEQDEHIYEYRMGSEVFRFEARWHGDAETLRGAALQYFAEHLGTLFSESALVGPDLVPFSEGPSETNRGMSETNHLDRNGSLRAPRIL